MGLPGGQGHCQGRPGIRGNQMKFGSSRPGICQWPGGRFFQRPGAIGMDLHAGAVQRDGLQGDAHDLLPLQILKDPLQDPTLGPAVHAGVDGMPLTEMDRQPPPLAPVLGHIQNGVQHLPIGEAHVAPLDR